MGVRTPMRIRYRESEVDKSIEDRDINHLVTVIYLVYVPFKPSIFNDLCHAADAGPNFFLGLSDGEWSAAVCVGIVVGLVSLGSILNIKAHRVQF